MTILNIEGFERREIKFTNKNTFSGFELFVDGQKIKPEKGKYFLTDNQGNRVEAKFDMGCYIDPCNAVDINGKKYKIREPLTWYQYAFCGWLISLIFVGGAIGGGLGAASTYFNVHILRSKMNGLLKFMLIFGSSVLAVILWLVLAATINQNFRK